ICRPRPLSPSEVGALGSGASSLGSVTASITSPIRRNRQSLSAGAFAPSCTNCGAVRIPCLTALPTSSAMISSASSERYASPQQVRSSLTNCLAVLASSATGRRGRLVIAGVSHHAEGTDRNWGGDAGRAGRETTSSSSSSSGSHAATLKWANATAFCILGGSTVLVAVLWG